MSLPDIIFHLPIAVNEVRKSLSTKLKQQRRKEYLEAHVAREFKFQIQQIGQPINNVLHKRRQVYKLEELIIDGQSTVRPGKIASAITQKFRDEWFHFPPGAANINWDKNLNDEASFMQLARSLGIETPEAEILWKAIKKRPTSSKLKAFQESVVQTPTYKAYKAQVDAGSVDSAGGMSDLTYAMIKSWPEHVHEEIYKALVENWSNNAIPEEWKWRWLLPLPKVPDPSLSQLRPICLLEVLRKLWSKIFVQRINEFMHQEAILHPGQHSGKGKGTDSAVLEFAAILETAKELNTELFLSSWDQRKAYDSVDRKVLLFAGIRSGIPHALVDYLLRMDYEAVMVIQTPLAMATNIALGKEGLTEHGLAFHPARGTAQGGVDSSLMYSLFLDILLCAIESSSDPDDSFYISDIDGNLQPAIPIAYVDDLVCASATAKGLQKVARIVSAFCILFHIELNDSKFRAFSINWGNPHLQDMNHMTIYTKGWIPSIVPLQHDGTMTHLGVEWDMSLHNTNMFEKVKQRAITALDLVVKSTHSATVRIAAIQISLMNQLVYETKFTTWPLEKYQEIDTIFNKAYRKISHNQVSFPTKLLYMSNEQLGLGYQQFSTQSQIAKFHLLQRSMYSSNPRRQFIVNSLTARVIRQMRSQPCRFGPYSLAMVELKLLPKECQDTWWFTSLAQHLSLTGVTIERDSIAASQLPFPIPQQVRNTQPCINSLIANGIVLPQELCMEGDPTKVMDFLRLSWAKDMVLPVSPLPLRQGQVWAKLTKEPPQYSVFEIAGFHDDDTIAYFPWTCVEFSNEGAPTKVSLRQGTGAMRGAGSAHSATLSSLFLIPPDSSYFIVNLESEQYLIGENVSHCKALRPRTPLIPQRPLSPQSKHPWFHNVTSEITTHVSLTPQSSIADIILGRERTDAKSFLIKTDHSTLPWTQHSIVIQHSPTPVPTLKSASVFALFVAASQSVQVRQTFTSTSKCGQSLHRKSSNKPVADPLTPLLQPHRAHRMFPLAPLSTTQSKVLLQLYKSPDRTLTLTSAQQQDPNLQTQIFVERSVNLLPNQLLKHHPSSSVTFANDTEFTLGLKRNPNGTLCNQSDHTPLLESYSEKHLRLLAAEYFQTRDHYRQEVHVRLHKHYNTPRYWEDHSSILAAAVLNKIPKGSTRAFVTRLIMDWHQTGSNIQKRSLDPFDALCPLCGAEMENQQHILTCCTHPHMQSVRDSHLAVIEKKLLLLHKDQYSTKLLNSYHKEAIKADQYELLLGRLHPHQMTFINSLPQAKSPTQAKSAFSTLVTHCRQYFAMAIALYRTRQLIIDLKEQDPSSNGIIPNFDTERQRVLAGEALMGISAQHFLKSDGTKITKPINMAPIDMISHKRKTLDVSNSVYLRTEKELFDKRARIDETRQQKLDVRRALKLISDTDQEEWNRMYPDDNSSINIHFQHSHPSYPLQHPHLSLINNDHNNNNNSTNNGNTEAAFSSKNHSVDTPILQKHPIFNNSDNRNMTNIANYSSTNIQSAVHPPVIPNHNQANNGRNNHIHKISSKTNECPKIKNETKINKYKNSRKNQQSQQIKKQQQENEIHFQSSAIEPTYDIPADSHPDKVNTLPATVQSSTNEFTQGIPVQVHSNKTHELPATVHSLTTGIIEPAYGMPADVTQNQSNDPTQHHPHNRKRGADTLTHHSSSVVTSAPRTTSDHQQSADLKSKNRSQKMKTKRAKQSDPGMTIAQSQYHRSRVGSSASITNYYSCIPISLPPSITIPPYNSSKEPPTGRVSSGTQRIPSASPPQNQPPISNLATKSRRSPTTRCSPGNPGGPTGQG